MADDLNARVAHTLVAAYKSGHRAPVDADARALSREGAVAVQGLVAKGNGDHPTGWKVAVIEGTRYSRLPDLPTVGEGIPGFALPVGFHGFLGPAGMPRPLINQLNAELIKALKLPEVEKRMAGFGLDIVISGPDEFGASIRSDYELFARIVKLLDIKPE